MNAAEIKAEALKKEKQAQKVEEQIIAKVAELKKKHGIKEVFVLQHEGKVAYLKHPSRDQMKYGMSVTQGSPLELTEYVLEAGWLEGDEEFKTDDALFYGVSHQVDEILEAKNVAIKKY